MESKKYPETLKMINLFPQFLILIMWLIQIFLTLDKEFMLVSAWPTPYKDAFNEDFTLYYIFYSVIMLLICMLSVMKSRLTAIAIPIIFIFEIYTFLSPILYKAIYYNTEQAIRYASAAFDITDKFFYVHTLKSLIMLAIIVMLFFAILCKKRKPTVILFVISAGLTVAFLIFEILNLVGTNSVSVQQEELIPKSIAVGILRMATLLPAFFIGFREKSKQN